MVVSDHEPVPRSVHVGLVPGAVAARQPQEGHPEVGADERVDERVDGRVYPTCANTNVCVCVRERVKKAIASMTC